MDAEVIQKYPPFVTSAEDRERWDRATDLAQAIFGDDGEAAVWGATRALYNSDIPTA